MTSFLCSNCGARIVVPTDFAKSKIRCPECGVFNSIPNTLLRDSGDAPLVRDGGSARSTKPTLEPKPRPEDAPPWASDIYTLQDDPLSVATPSRPTQPAGPAESTGETREILLQGTEDDDLNPYTVKGDAPTQPCPGCQERLPLHAVVCVRCGYHLETKRAVKRRFEPVYRTWESGWPLQQRFFAFVVLQMVNLVAFALVVASGRDPTTMVFTVVSASVLQAFLCGTYDRLELSRTAKGKVSLTSHWRIAFYPLPPREINWKEHESVTLVQSNDFDPIGWVMFLILLGYCVVPGLIFWWFAIHRDKFTVMLCRGHGFPETPIFRTLDDKRGMEVRDTVSEVTGLPVHR